MVTRQSTFVRKDARILLGGKQDGMIYQTKEGRSFTRGFVAHYGVGARTGLGFEQMKTIPSGI